MALMGRPARRREMARWRAASSSCMVTSAWRPLAVAREGSPTSERGLGRRLGAFRAPGPAWPAAASASACCCSSLVDLPRLCRALKPPARQRVSVLVGSLATLLGGEDRGHGRYAEGRSPGYRKERRMRFVPMAVVAAFALATPIRAEDWPSFRGPRG